MITSFKISNRLQRIRNISNMMQSSFGGGHDHHEKPYDWRDDPKVNQDLTEDIRDRGWDQTKYTFPYKVSHDGWRFDHFPSNYQSTDLTVNLRPENQVIEKDFTAMRAPYTDLDNDIAHEYDYESEDLDHQPESFDFQHFRQKGALWMWMIAGALPLIYYYLEFFYQHYPDEDHWKIARPPPLDYPNTEDTDDSETYMAYQTKTARYLVDSGQIGEIWFDIKDGKKIYKPEALVNQPMEDI